MLIFDNCLISYYDIYKKNSGHEVSCRYDYGLSLRYLPATLKANEDKIIKTVTASSFISILFRSELSLSFSDDVKTPKIPITPKAVEA